MENAQAYQIRGMRASQNDEMPITCLKRSVSREVYIKIYNWNDKYIVARQPILEQVKDTSDHHPPNRPENTWHHWTKRIAVKSDLSKWCEHTRELIQRVEPTKRQLIKRSILVRGMNMRSRVESPLVNCDFLPNLHSASNVKWSSNTAAHLGHWTDKGPKKMRSYMKFIRKTR